MMNGKKLVTGCLAGSLLLGTMAMPAQALNVSQLKDVAPTSWYYSSVKYVTEHEYMLGVTSDRFAPDAEMNRAMFVTILHRLDGAAASGEKSKFVDVPEGTWYTQAVNWAAGNGIVNGVGENRFAPDSSITREQMCMMMASYLNYRASRDKVNFLPTVAEKAFTDAGSISEYARSAVKQCQMWGLVAGNETGAFQPQNNSTRAQVATVIQRLDAMIAASETGGNHGGGNHGGGGGGGGTTSKTANYEIKVKLDLPGSVSQADPELLATYNNVTISGTSVSGDKTLGEVVNDLMTGENATILRNGISEVLGKAKGKTFTQTVNGQLVTISVSSEGVVSASVSMKVTDLTDAKARVTQAELEELIEKLQKGGEMTFNKEDLPAMEELLNKANTLNGMSDEEIQRKMDEYAAGNPALEQAMEGMTPKAVKDAVADYAKELDEIKSTVEKAEGESVVIQKDPVVMNVAMDLGVYYQKAVDKFESSKKAAIDRLEAELYPAGEKLTGEQRAKAEALYAVNNPAGYVTDNKNGTLTLKSASDYVKLLQDNSSAGIAFYKSLGENEAFYQGLLDRLEKKYQDGYGITYSMNGLAAVLGDNDGILVDQNNAFRGDATFSIAVDLNEDTYSKWAELLNSKLGFLGGMLPGQLPEGLSALMGDYTLTFTIDKK